MYLDLYCQLKHRSNERLFMKWTSFQSVQTCHTTNNLDEKLTVLIPGRVASSCYLQKTTQTPHIRSYILQEHISIQTEFLCFAFKIKLDTSLTYPIQALLIPNGFTKSDLFRSYTTLMCHISHDQLVSTVAIFIKMNDLSIWSEKWLSLSLQIRPDDFTSSQQIYFTHLKSYSTPSSIPASVVLRTKHLSCKLSIPTRNPIIL